MTSESADDLNRKYQQSYVMYRGQLTWIQKIYQENAGQVKVCGENREGQYIEEWLEPDMLQPFTLDQALVNVTSFRGIKYGASVPLILFRRSPRRQWRRGICSDNSTVTCPVRPMLRRFNIQVNVYESLSWKVIHHLLNPTYPTLERALAYCHKCMAVAISPMFFVCLHSQSLDRYLLGSAFGLIGEAQPGRVWIHHAPAQQEVIDYITRTNQKTLVNP